MPRLEVRATDAALVRQALTGENAAFDALVERYRGVVYQAARRLTGDAHLAWDATQEAFVAAYRGLGSLQRPERFGPWLKRIAQRACARLVRMEHRAEPAEPAALERVAEARAVAERRPHADSRPDAAEAVRRALAGLGPTGRRAAELHYFDGLSCDEVGAFLGLSVGAVKTRLHRSRETLRRELVRMGAPGAKKLVIRYVTHWGWGAESLFHEAKSKELYAALYPRRSLQNEVWADAGLSREDALRIVARWEGLGVVRRRGNALTCLMPVVTDDDDQIMRPWREEIVERAMPGLHRQVPRARTAVEEVVTDRPQVDNVFTTLLLVYVLHWSGPLCEFRGGVLGSRTERGAHASYWCSGEARSVIPPSYGLRNFHGRGQEWHMGVVNAGNRCSRFDGLLDKWGGYFSGSQAQVLAAIGEGSVGDRELPLILRAAGYDVGDQEKLLADFEQAQLIERAGRRWRLAIPVLHRRDLTPTIRACHRVAGEMAQAFEAAMPTYERRVAQCSFRRCAFGDAAVKMLSDAEGAVIHRAMELGLLPGVPDEPAGDWGVFLLFRDGQKLW